MTSYDLRCKEATRLYQGAVQLSTASQDPLAQAAVRFISPENCPVTEPIAQGEFWGLQGKTDATTVSITPLLCEDKDVHEHFNDLLENQRLIYAERERSIYMPAATFSSAVGGLVLIHEGIHAYAHAAHMWRNYHGHWSHWYEEARVFASELNVLRAVSPVLYRETVVQKVATLHAMHTAEGFSAEDTFASDDHAAAMVESLGDRPNQSDILLMKNILGIGAVYYMVSDGFILSDESLTKAASYLHYLYGAPADPTPLPRMKMPLSLMSSQEKTIRQ